jgi:hypothetical protein
MRGSAEHVSAARERGRKRQGSTRGASGAAAATEITLLSLRLRLASAASDLHGGRAPARIARAKRLARERTAAERSAAQRRCVCALARSATARPHFLRITTAGRGGGGGASCRGTSAGAPPSAPPSAGATASDAAAPALVASLPPLPPAAALPPLAACASCSCEACGSGSVSRQQASDSTRAFALRANKRSAFQARALRNCSRKEPSLANGSLASDAMAAGSRVLASGAKRGGQNGKQSALWPRTRAARPQQRVPQRAQCVKTAGARVAAARA